ncbi:MAG TPA: flagellar hook-associated protein FlgK [Oxalicibacterium sp.]|nr:flagellar hook-associated protein FlgK [Oxalicibacterium sp.]
MANILSIAQSGLVAAQAGLATTSHNISNQGVAGYSRQQIIQSSAGGQNYGYGFIGNGTNVDTIKRAYDSFLGVQANGVQSTKSQLDSYYTQINQINNMIADASSGLSPAIQNFFTAIQDLVSDPSGTPSRQSMLSGAQSLAARFQSLDTQLRTMQDSVNTQIQGSVTNINSYAQQIAQLNNAIAKAQSTGQPPNDLLDQRDQLTAQLSKESKVTVVVQDGNYNVFVGNGQPLVVGNVVNALQTVASSTDIGRLEVGYTNAGGSVVTLPEDSLSGGTLGGLFQFRSQTLDPVQNSLGRIAMGLADTFNAQHKLGVDLNGNAGGDFFNVASPVVTPDARNTGSAVIGASITDVGALTASDYRLSYDGTNYTVTRLSDNTSVYSNTTFPAAAIDGVQFSETSGTMAAGDKFVIRPTINGASDFSVLITDTSAIAAATPIRTSVPTSNAGNATISTGTIDSTYSGGEVPTTLTYDATTTPGTFSGFPAGLDVIVTANGTSTTYTAPAAAVPYTAGATIAFGGVQVQISGTPKGGDTFSIVANTSGTGDNRNILALGALQNAKTLLGGTADYNSAYSQIVGSVGNKTREMQVNSDAQGKLLTSIQSAQQSQSGVNLDEEATNLIRYQQAYQASAKVMQVVSDLFGTLLSIAQ